MCFPNFLQTAGMAVLNPTVALAGVTSAGGGLDAYGQYQAGRASEAAANYNAKLLKQQARDEVTRGGIEEQRLRRQQAAFMGRQRAAAGGSGAVASSGSPLNLLAQTAEDAEMDALTLRNNAYRSAWGLNNQAALTKFEGRQARRAGIMNAGSSLLTSGAQAFGMFT